jgi:hypothetical protein
MIGVALGLHLGDALEINLYHDAPRILQAHGPNHPERLSVAGEDVVFL